MSQEITSLLLVFLFATSCADRQELLAVEVDRNEAEYRCLQARSDYEVGLMALNSFVDLPFDIEIRIGEAVLPVENVAETISDASPRNSVLQI